MSFDLLWTSPKKVGHFPVRLRLLWHFFCQSFTFNIIAFRLAKVRAFLPVLNRNTSCFLQV